jgi:sulfur-oxidizing protein SoxY
MVGLAQALPRLAIGQSGAPAQLPTPPGSPAALTRPARPAAAFGATTVGTALAALGAGSALPSGAIALDAPAIATERGAISVAVSSSLPGVTQVAVLVDRASFPLAALLRPERAGQPWQVTVHLERSARITAAVQVEGRWYSVSREVKVAAQPW